MAIRSFLPVFILVFTSLATPSRSADLLESLGLKKSSEAPGLSALAEDQVVDALKEALGKGIQHAITNLGRADGFLKDANVRIPLPESLQKIERGLRAVGEGH